MIIQIKDVHINMEHVSMLTVKNKTLVVDFVYSKPDGPVFLAFEFDSKEEAEGMLRHAVRHYHYNCNPDSDE